MSDILIEAASQARGAPASQALSEQKEERAALDWLSMGWRYQVDVWQRTLLFLDTLRQRADNAIEHERAGMPPLLDFEYETRLDARTFERPANYVLLRITAVGADCYEDCVDETARPVIVLDPRAGHGPGIGGFKRDSEVGMAMHEGHLGIFVSAAVAGLEHRAILESAEELEALQPGLYEMQIVNPTGDPNCRKPQYRVVFEERRVEDLRFEQSPAAFEKVRRLSELNESVYSDFVSPWVQAWTTPWSAELTRSLHPLRWHRYLFSDRYNPSMALIGAMASQVREQRRPATDDNPYRQLERQASQQVSEMLDTWRRVRDTGYELLFKGPPLIHQIYNPGHHSDQSIYNAMRNGVRQHHWPYGDMPKQEGIGFYEASAIVKFIREVQDANGIIRRQHR